jgi:hypothetical protein
MYLDRHLDHDNHETIEELAEQFHDPILAGNGRRFATRDKARSELYKRKVKAERKVIQVSRRASTIRK